MARAVLVIFTLLMLFVGCDVHDKYGYVSGEVDFETSPRVFRGQYEGIIDSSGNEDEPSVTPVNLTVEATYKSEFTYLVQGTLTLGIIPPLEYRLTGEVSTNTEKYVRVQHAGPSDPYVSGTLTRGDGELEFLMRRRSDNEWSGYVFYSNEFIGLQVTRVTPTVVP